MTLSVESAQTETVPWARTPGTPSASNLGLKAWGAGEQAWGAGSPLLTLGLGDGCPSGSLEGKKPTGLGWDWAGVRLLGANASSPGHRALCTEFPGTNRDWQGDWERDPGTRGPRPASLSRPTPLAPSHPFILSHVGPMLHVFTLFLFHLLPV